jgi:hypothetical protein
MKSALKKVIARLEERRAQPSPAVRMPGLWLNPDGPVAAQSVVPEEFFLHSLRGILASPRKKRVTDGDVPGDWGKNAIAYNLLVRYGAPSSSTATARSPASQGFRWREPALPQGDRHVAVQARRLQRDSPGPHHLHRPRRQQGRPWAAPSPSATLRARRAPRPKTRWGSTWNEFAAFVEAAHHSAFRIVVEFVSAPPPRRLLAKEHPEWFY